MQKMLIQGILLVSICLSAQAAKLVPVKIEVGSGTDVQVTVQKEGGLLDTAEVWVEDSYGKEIAKGTATSAVFSAPVDDEKLKNGIIVTAYFKGFIPVTVTGVVGRKVTLTLPKDPSGHYIALHGTVTGYADNSDSGTIQAGIVARAFQPADLGNLDVGSLVSPWKDTVEAYGAHEIPSNITLPDQTFQYIVPIHIAKPDYRLPIMTGTSDRYFTATGTAPVEELQNIGKGSAWGILNSLTFSKAGISAPVVVSENVQTDASVKLDLNANTAIAGIKKFEGGNHSESTDSNKHLLIPMWESIKDVLVPTDIKLVKPSGVNVAMVDTKHGKVLDLWVTTSKPSGEQHFLATWIAPNAGTKLPDTSFQGDLNVQTWDTTWEVRGGESAGMVIAHLEQKVATGLGNDRQKEKWILVSPGKAVISWPVVAMSDLKDRLGPVTFASADLLRTQSGGYPLVEGDAAASGLKSVEKIRKPVR